MVRELSAVKEELLRSISFLDVNHVFNLIVSSKEKSILKCRHVQQNKLRILIPGYKPETSLDSHDPEKGISNFSSHILSDSEKSLLCKGLRFALPAKKIDYADFPLQFELLYRDTLQFNLPSEKRDLLKNKLKDICSSTLNCYNFDKVNTNLIESESKALKELIQRKDLVIQEVDKGNTVVITDCENYLKGIKSLLSDNTKFIPLNINQSKCSNYILNLAKKLKEHFKIIEKDNKISEDEFKSISPISTRPGVFYGQPKVRKTVINNISQFRQFYELLTHQFIN